MTAPAVTATPVDWSALQPVCGCSDCDRAAQWIIQVHNCPEGEFIDHLICDPCLNEYRTNVESVLPKTCICDIRWVSWRHMCPRQVRL